MQDASEVEGESAEMEGCQDIDDMRMCIIICGMRRKGESLPVGSLS